MFFLDDTGKSLQALTLEAITTSNLTYVVVYNQVSADITQENRPYCVDGSVTEVAAAMVGAPAADVSYNIRTIHINNPDTVDHNVVVRLLSSGAPRILFKAKLSPGWTLTYFNEKGWAVLNDEGIIIDSTMLTAGQKPYYANVPNGGVGLISASSNIATQGVDTNGATIYTAGTKGGRVQMLTGTTNDTIAVNVFIWILRGATVIPLGLVAVAASSGDTNANRANVDLLDGANLLGTLRDANSKLYIPLMPNDVLRCGSLAGLTAGKKCWIEGQGADYQA